MSTRVINQNTYSFVQTIATKFDEQAFPGTDLPPLILDPKKDGLKWEPNGDGSVEVLAGSLMRRNLAANFSREICALIASKASNFSQWAVILGLTDPRVKMKPLALDHSAASLLKRMNIEPNNSTPSDQLLTVAFEKVFESCTEDEKIGLINQMNSCKTVLESRSFKFQFLVFRAQSFAAVFFSNIYVQFVLGWIVARQAKKFYGFGYDYVMHSAKTKFVPKAVNLFINNAPTLAVKVTNVFIEVIVYTVDNPIKVTIGSWIAAACTGAYSPYAYQIRTIVLFPITITDKIAKIPSIVANRAFGFSTAFQNKLSEISTAGKDQVKNKILAEGAPKAYQLWKHLMMNPEQLYA
ncbi:MAG: hypothetical protein ABSA17_04300 [Rhabdochlamydiaceae bacterium]